MKKSVSLLIIALILLMPISLAYEEKTYIYGNNLIASKDSNNNIIYYNQDYLSSNRVISNNNGNIIGKNVQEPYGSTYEETGTKEALTNDYKFTGKEEDIDNSLYYFGARYYEPSNGRFISVDPVFDSSKSPYAYANNNPMKYIDPSGMQTTFEPLKETFHLTDEQIGLLRKGEDIILPTKYLDYGTDAYVEADFLLRYNPADEVITYGIFYIKSEPRGYGRVAWRELEDIFSDVSARMGVKNANVVVMVEINERLFERLRKSGFEDISEFKTNVLNTRGLVEDVAPTGVLGKTLKFSDAETASRVAGKSARRLLAERGLKMVPVLGIGFGIWGAYNEVRTGDFVGAGAECIGAFCDPVDYIALLGLVCPNIETTGEGERMMEVGKYDEKNNAYR